MRPTTNFANNLKSVNLQTPNKRTQTITLLLWNAFMANMSHPLRALICFGLLAVSAFILTLPRARAQAPPDGAAVPTRPAETVRDGADRARSKISASRHPLDPLEPAEIELAVAAIRKDRQLSDSVRFVTVTLKEPSKDVVRQPSPAAARPARRS